MNDPHVVAVHYRVESAERLTYDNPPAEHLTTSEFDLVVHDEVAVATLHVHCATAEEAKRLVEPVLEAWEIEAALANGGLPQLQFAFDSANIIDRSPPPAGRHVLEAEAGMIAIAGFSATATITRRRYPPPPTIRVAADVETLWFRYSLWRDGRDLLPGMAYFCLTTVEGLGGSRAHAARQFGISISVLKTLGRLSSSVGDRTTIRKLSKDAELRPHTAAENSWMDAAVRAIIRRVGEHAAGITPLSTITIADLPPLS